MHAFVFFFNFVNLFQFILPYKLLATAASNNFFGEKFWRIFKVKNLLLAESFGFGHFLASDCSTSLNCSLFIVLYFIIIGGILNLRY